MRCTRFAAVVLTSLGLTVSGCHYAGVNRPTVSLGILPSSASEDELAKMLAKTPRAQLPSDLLVVKLRGNEPYRNQWNDADRQTTVEPPEQAEADSWRAFDGLKAEGGQRLINHVTVAGPMFIAERATLDALRVAAARVQARLVFVYASVDNSEEGYNNASLLYWTIVGMWVVPGSIVGYYSAAQGLLIDTQTGQIVAVIDGASKYEETVPAAALDIAKTRARNTARTQALGELQAALKTKLGDLLKTSGAVN